MNWTDSFLFCFVVGFALSLFSFLGGALHLPHLHFHGHGHHGVTRFPAAMAFLTWFGGAGYLLSRYSGVSVAIALLCAAAAGLVSGWVVLRLLSRVVEDEQPLSSDDYRMVGVLGRISSPVREGGTGEMIFSLQGTRRGIPVRSEDREPLARDTEVVVTRFERGIAYVKQWDELSR